MDRVTRYLNIALTMLFVGHPIRTSLGVLFGAALHSLATVMSPTLDSFPKSIDFSGLSVWQYLVLGVFVLHLPTYISYLVKWHGTFDENTEKALALIREARKDKRITSSDAAKLYLELCRKAVENSQINLLAATRGDDQRVGNQGKISE